MYDVVFTVTTYVASVIYTVLQSVKLSDLRWITAVTSTPYKTSTVHQKIQLLNYALK